MCVKSLLTLCNLMDCSLPGSSVHGILPARILAWIAMPSSRGSSPPRDLTQISYVSCTGRLGLYHWVQFICNIVLVAAMRQSGSVIYTHISTLAAQWSRIHRPVQETQVQSLGLEDPLEGEIATYSSRFLPRKSHGQRSWVGYSPRGHKRVRHDSAIKQQ